MNTIQDIVFWNPPPFPIQMKILWLDLERFKFSNDKKILDGRCPLTDIMGK